MEPWLPEQVHFGELGGLRSITKEASNSLEVKLQLIKKWGYVLAINHYCYFK